LLGNRKLNTYMDTLTSRYCRFAWLPSNRGRMVTWIRSPLPYCCVYVGCIATNSGKASVSIGTARCFKGKAIHNSELVSLWKRKKSVFISLRQYVSESSSVSLRNQKSTVHKVNYRRRKPVFRRAAVVNQVRSFSVYLVVCYCVSS
jgi:hypothetical protein